MPVLPNRSLAKRLFYRSIRFTSRLLVVILFDFRTAGRERIPGNGGGLILATHQSLFDPVLVGLVFNRRLNYLARKSLFANSILARLIRILDAIEIDRDRSGLSGLRESLKRLENGELVLIFPEGTRTPDGRIGPLKAGFLPVARRAQVPLIPVSVVGAYDVLRRGAKLPTRHPIGVVIGESISPETIASLDNDALLAHVAFSLEECNCAARRMLHLRAKGP